MAKAPPPRDTTEVIHAGKAAGPAPKLTATVRPRRRRRATPPPIAAATGAPAPQPQPLPRTPVDMSTPTGRSHALAETVVMSILDKLRHEAHARGGALSLADLDRLAAEFHGKTAALRQVFEQTFESYANARERAKFAQNRNFPFDRVLVRRFEHLLARGPTGDPDKISRRFLHGFFIAVQMMLGAEILEGYQERCRDIVARLRVANKGKFAWPDLYQDPATAELAAEALATMASYFSAFEKRSAWFMTIVNGNLAPAERNASHLEASWQVSEAAFRRFLAALFAEVREMVATPDARTRFTERFGIERCMAAVEAMERLYGR